MSDTFLLSSLTLGVLTSFRLVWSAPAWWSFGWWLLLGWSCKVLDVLFLWVYYSWLRLLLIEFEEQNQYSTSCYSSSQYGK